MGTKKLSSPFTVEIGTQEMAFSVKKYDVFISFRGEDTRSNFVSHLRNALDRDRIKTYTDEDKLGKGDQVWASLSQAIQDSHVAIVIFSQNYAFSKWCLKELVKILECRKSEGLIVIPVFYEVDPSHIRKFTGIFKEAMAKHEKFFGDRDNESIKEWKDALIEASNICGWDSRTRLYKNEAQIIDKIVEDVLEKLNQRSPIELKVEGLVGIDKICEEVKLLLSRNQKNRLLQNVKVIRIWGMGGIGKTTIAKALFCQLFPQYDSVCFLANVREESKRLGLMSLRGKLLSKLLKKEYEGSDVAESTFYTRRLNDKKVLIVLDDVNSLDQLDVLYRECNYVGPNSKIIITTRDRHLLISASVDEIYDVKMLNLAKSLELFSLHAFKERHPQKGYEDLSRRAVAYAGGVPLALKILGSNLYSRSTQFWDSELSKLMNCTNDRIQSVLQVSYDGLDSLEKKIFLDIAFFFKGENKGDIIRILDACGFGATSGVNVLEDKALITISLSGTIQMHDLIQEMGLNIVREGIENPRKRSRLKDIEEVPDVLGNNKGSNAVEGITLDLSEIEDLQVNADALSMMTNLRILKLYVPFGNRSGKVHWSGVLSKLSDKLRYLEWHGYPLKSLPASFSAKRLVEIHMRHSNLTELWEGVQDVVNLVRINLSKCKQLKNLPDLSKASKLERVDLYGCESLVAVHPSVLSLDKLKILVLDECKNLKSLKSGKHLRSLECICVDGCTSLREFSVSSDLIKWLDLCNTGIETLDSSIERLRNLRTLDVHGLRCGYLPSELCFLKDLRELKICKCRIAIEKENLHVIFDGLAYLKVLHLKDCCNLYELPHNISTLTNLHELRLDGSSVKTLPESIKHLKNLETLSLENCRKLVSIPELPPSVTILEAQNCVSLVKIPTLETLTFEMKGRRKSICFQNCMGLDEPRLHCITEGAYIATYNAVFQSRPVNRSRKSWRRSISYLSENCFLSYCIPGRRVPEEFTYRTTRSSFSINLPSSISDFAGLIFGAVLSPSQLQGTKTRINIWCQCYLGDGRKLACATEWRRRAVNVTGLSCDHVYMWCDTVHFKRIMKIYRTGERQVWFKFFVTSDMGESHELNIQTRECGVYVLLKSKEELESPHCQTSHHTHANHEPDFSDNCSCNCLFEKNILKPLLMD
ncbi:disease resistance-like protein DSC1 [Abrus precatorius]|uniref:Disease resistance-like protein DSC1 n=1 Tax=Abrus precatorius TaxID=3816 RepID=A0A8B8LM57_ABRPR|nr:disease resistance-like protein DSC1 [Abrus precatorius]